MAIIDEVTTAGGDEPSWKQRAVERTRGAAKLRGRAAGTHYRRSGAAIGQ
jgi:hypothetical protein